jgi:predicted 2-oxoglutarate/Fe(II)-dependent dioxygenase YbiX
MNSISHIRFKIFTDEQVKEINKRIRTSIGYKGGANKYASVYKLKMGEFFHVPCPPLMELLHPFTKQCQLINRNHFQYDIYWDFHLEEFNYNVYGEGAEYGWHVDGNPDSTPIDMKLTCILNLSEEPYEGGNFFMTPADEKVEVTSGEAIVFTSLIAHRVTPITKGERITLTYWGRGPSWR